MRFLTFCAALVSILGLTRALPRRDVFQGPRLSIYFQTTHDALGNPISMLPLIQEQGIALTHLIVCSLHINVGSVVHLNDFPPDNPRFSTLWNETAIMKAAGVKVMGMVGGAAPGSFDTDSLDAPDEPTFEYYYGQLRDVISQFELDGMDLDVEQWMSQDGILRLVSRLHADFGDDFIITLAPVASALMDGGNLSGFDYEDLAAVSVTSTGNKKIDFYNAQFYSGFGTMASPDDFEAIVANGWDPKEILAGQLTNPSNGYGYTPFPSLNETVREIVAEYGTIGGIMGWEYFNSEPGDTTAPWKWAQEMTEILRPNDVASLTVTEEKAAQLEVAWKESVIQPASGDSETGRAQRVVPKVNYRAMVNA